MDHSPVFMRVRRVIRNRQRILQILHARIRLPGCRQTVIAVQIQTIIGGRKFHRLIQVRRTGFDVSSSYFGRSPQII